MTGGVRSALVRQFGHPRGLLGRVAGLVMERRPSNRERNRRTLDLLEIGPGDRVLEVGFGPGLAIQWAVERGARVVGIEHSELMLERAARRNADAVARGSVELRLARVEELSEREAFDKAYAVNVFMFWKDPAAVLRRVAAALRPGGRLAITHQPRQPGATNTDALRSAQKIASHLAEAGFEQVRIEVLEMEPVNATCVLASTRPDLTPASAGC